MFAGGDGAAVLADAAGFAVLAAVQTVKRLRYKARGRNTPTAALCPTMSENVWGLYLRYSEIYMFPLLDQSLHILQEKTALDPY